MKKGLICLGLLLTLFTSTASADRLVYKKPNYNFGDFKTIQVTNISMLNVDNKDFITDKTADSKVAIALRGAMAKKGVTVRMPDQIPASTPGTRSLTSIPEVSIKVYCIGYDHIYRKAWVETRRVMDTYSGQVGFDWSKTLVVTVPKTIKIDHPEGYYDNAEVDIEINILNPLTKDPVYTVRDSRSEGDSTNPANLLAEIFKAFAKDVK